MLVIISGEIQIGKTRWLQDRVSRLEKAGIICEGVLAPGVWLGPDAAGAYDKVGIINELLPSHERITFARRADLARAEGTFDPTSQSAAERLSWSIDEAAIERVNGHFDVLASRARAGSGDDGARRLLLIDELGRLELMKSGGLTSAMALLAAGPLGHYTLAVAVVRRMFGLCDEAARRFGPAWGGAKILEPSDAAWDLICAELGVAQA